jgi:hypothetical protein
MANKAHAALSCSVVNRFTRATSDRDVEPRIPQPENGPTASGLESAPVEGNRAETVESASTLDIAHFAF